MKRSRRFAGRESGQGTIEYILILLIVIIITLSIVHQFHSGFRSYVDAFFDGYIACLLEVGELPGTGAICEAEFPDYAAHEGKMLLKANVPEPGGSSGGAEPSSEDTNSENSESQSSSSGPHSETVASSSGGGGGGGGRTNVGSFGRGGRRTSTPVGNVKSSEEGSAFGNDALLGSPRSAAVGNVRQETRQESTRMDFTVWSQEEEQEQTRPRVAVAGKPRSSDALRPKKAVENLNRKPALNTDDEAQGISIGEFIRFLFIIAIIVAVVVFFGGQLLQISKGREKG